MKIIDADATRLIELPGVGPCPRPVDIDQSISGFERLKSLRIYRFDAGIAIEGESESDEVYVLPIGGAVDLEITGRHQLNARVSDTSPPHALYLTPDHAYRLKPAAGVQVAYARAAARGDVACHVVDGGHGSRAETLAFHRVRLAAGDVVAQDASKERLIHIVDGALAGHGVAASCGQTIALAAGETAELRANGTATVIVFSA